MGALHKQIDITWRCWFIQYLISSVRRPLSWVSEYFGKGGVSWRSSCMTLYHNPRKDRELKIQLLGSFSDLFNSFLNVRFALNPLNLGNVHFPYILQWTNIILKLVYTINNMNIILFHYRFNSFVHRWIYFSIFHYLSNGVKFDIYNSRIQKCYYLFPIIPARYFGFFSLFFFIYLWNIRHL